VDHILKDGFVGRTRRRPAGYAGVGKDNVESSEIFGKGREEPLAVFGNCKVGTIAARIRPEFRNRFIECLLVPAGDGDLGAFCDKEASSGKTNATIASSDESFLA
jgi:hypothetical protein